MFIQTEDTPNPQTMKFLPGRPVTRTPVDLRDAAEAAISPLAQALFAIDGVEAVFLGTDFISVTRRKDGAPTWAILRPALLEAMLDHFASDKPVLAEKTSAFNESTENETQDDDVVAQIKTLLDLRIRPAVAQDGGDVGFEGYEDGIVYLRLKGACAGCPSATATLKFGIEQMLRHFIPEVQEVRRVLD